VGTHQSRLPYIIPQDSAIEPSCPECDADTSEAFYEVVNGILDEDDDIDWRNVKVTCPHCRRQIPITKLKDRAGIFCAREYIYFADVTVEDVADFEVRLRNILRNAGVKSYGYT